MKLFAIEEKEKALQIMNLQKLYADCLSLTWSTYEPHLPDSVANALIIVEDYAAKQTEEICKTGQLICELDEECEEKLSALISSNPTLRNTIGTCVVLSEQIDEVRDVLQTLDAPDLLISALRIQKNIAII